MKYLIIFIFLVSCSPQKKLHKLLNKHPELNTTETITIHDTVIVESVKVEDQYIYSEFLAKDKDSVVVNKGKLHVKLSREKDQVRLEAECKADTIYKVVEVKVDKILYQQKESNLYKALFFIMLIVLVLIVMYRQVSSK